LTSAGSVTGWMPMSFPGRTREHPAAAIRLRDQPFLRWLIIGPLAADRHIYQG
jgi:hypothetical protein